MASPFSWEQGQQTKRSVTAESSTFHLNDQ
jgi:hypothetical protein